MAARMYSIRNYSSALWHYGATAALVTGSVLLGQPWMVGAALAVTGGATALSLNVQKKFFENSLERHPDIHKDSPRLGKIVEGLYKASGLKADNYPVYNFRVKKSKAEQGVFGGLMDKLMDMMGQTHNAAAINLSKPVIIVSEPLLKLLDDNEEKAVLAHEFAHAKARHQHLGMPQRFAAGVARMTAGLARFVEMLSAGVWGIANAIGAGVLGILVVRAIHPNGKLMSKNDKSLSLGEVQKKKRVSAFANALGGAATLAVLTAYNPVYLPVWMATKALKAGAGLLQATFSRSMEYQADKGAVKLGADPLALATALRKMTLVQKRSVEEAYGGNLPRRGFLSKAWKQANSTHPTVDRRVARLAKMAKKQGATKERIQQAVKGKLEVSQDNNLSREVIEKMVQAM